MEPCRTRKNLNSLSRGVPEHREKLASEFSRTQLLRQSEQHLQEEDATIQIGSAISEGAFHHSLGAQEKAAAGAVIHYIFGACVGAIYGAACEVYPISKTGGGVPFGAGLFAIADGVGVPVLGFSRGFARGPLAKHAYGLATHIVMD